MKEILDIFIAYAPTIATIFFSLSFCYIIFFTLNKKNKKRFEDDANIPFKDKQD